LELPVDFLQAGAHMVGDCSRDFGPVEPQDPARGWPRRGDFKPGGAIFFRLAAKLARHDCLDQQQEATLDTRRLQIVIQRREARGGIADKDLHFHDSRGTAAIKFYTPGLPIRVIAEMLAWNEDQIERIIRRYVARAAAIENDRKSFGLEETVPSPHSPMAD
jgi:hypothetical protein